MAQVGGEVVNILVIDDTKAFSLLVKFILEKEGHKVAIADDVFAGVQKIKALTPDIIILDLEIPGGGGFEVYHQMKRDFKQWDTPIVAITGSSDGLLFDQARKLGITACWSKGAPVDELLALITSKAGK